MTKSSTQKQHIWSAVLWFGFLGLLVIYLCVAAWLGYRVLRPESHRFWKELLIGAGMFLPALIPFGMGAFLARKLWRGSFRERPDRKHYLIALSIVYGIFFVALGGAIGFLITMR